MYEASTKRMIIRTRLLLARRSIRAISVAIIQAVSQILLSTQTQCLTNYNAWQGRSQNARLCRSYVDGRAMLTLAAALSFVDVKPTNWAIAAFWEGVYDGGIVKS